MLRAFETTPAYAPDGFEVEDFFSARVRRRLIARWILAMTPVTEDERLEKQQVVIVSAG